MLNLFEMTIIDYIDNNKLPIIVAPMFLVSDIKLVKACLNNNTAVCFPSLNASTPQQLDLMLNDINSMAKNNEIKIPYGVNIVAHKSNKRFETDLDLCIKHKVPLIVTALGINKKLIERVHNYGGHVFHDVTTLKHAKKAIEEGADGLILVSAGAGGHGGLLNPFAFISEVKQIFNGPVVLSGGITTGAGCAAAIQAGADLAYIGTKFICTTESAVDDSYKNAIINANSADILYTDAVSGVHANFLKQSLIDAGIDINQLNEHKKIDFSKETDKIKSKAWSDIKSAGHGVGSINKIQAVAELIDELRIDFYDALKKQKEKSKKYLNQE